jgi:diguanylate cyclase (GGDEF)-like protein
VQVLQGLVAVGLVVYAVTVLVRGPSNPSVLLDGWLLHVVLAGAASLCLLRGALVRVERVAWLSLGVGLLAWTSGNAYWRVTLHIGEALPYPSLADLGWLSVYPFAYLTLARLVRRSVVRFQASLWLDGVIGGLGAAALSASVFLGPIVAGTGGDFGAVATNLAYPVGDLLVLVLVTGVFALLGWQPGRAWWLLAAGFVGFAVADTGYLFQAASGTYTVGTLLDVLYPAAMALMGFAAWQPPRDRQRLRLEGWPVLVMPLVFTLVSLGVLFRATLTPVPLVATSLALAAVLAAVVRTGLTFREARGLADSRRQARTDELTGLPNRRSAYEALARVDAQLDAGGSVAVLLVDLDRFKEVNDSLGHAAGDELLRQVGPRLTGHLRHADLLARVGGDEFVVLAPDLDAAGAYALAARLRSMLQQPFQVATMTLTIDASVGIGVGPEQSRVGEELLQMADLAMYSAKARRVGIGVYDDARDGRGRHRLETVDQLRNGIRRGELVLHYQPKLALHTNRVIGVEALVRWQHPVRGLLYPDAFIDLAETFGLMRQLTLTVLDTALAQCRSWADQGQQLSVAVNVSPSDLVDEHFPDEVAVRLAAHRLPPTSLVLEVTESLLMEDRERAVSVLARLRDIGVGVAIDDYGTGYSSLAYLAELPVTELKLDRAFIGSMTDSPRNAAIVTSTLQLAHALGLALVAEGAEDQATVDALRTLGCDVMQGYHLSRPLPPDRLLAWLEARAATVPAQHQPTPRPRTDELVQQGAVTH